MTPEIWTIIGVGIALAGLVLSAFRSLRIDLNRRMDRLEERMDELRKDQAKLDNRMAHLEDLLEGLREAITQNRAA